VLAITRFRVSEGEGDAFLDDARAALEVLSERPGFVRGHLGRCTDDASLWVLSTEWQGVGAYRRALSSYDVKMGALALLQRAEQEPSAFEVIETVEGAP
jgi:quinol monooxygenase YgiN